MKAAQDFTILIDKDSHRIFQSYVEVPKDCKELKFKKGDEVPKEYVGDLALLNREFLDIKYVDGIAQLDGVVATRKKPRSEYMFTRNELTEKLNKIGFDKFRDWAKKKFEVTAKSGIDLISAIINKQEDDFQKGE